MSRFWKKYATFTGRASRSEYWWAFLFMWLMLLIPAIMMGIGISQEPTVETADFVDFDNVWYNFGALLSAIITLVFIIPNIALIWRRLHDANLAGPFFFLMLIPGVGHLILFIMMLLPSNPAGARFDAGR